VPAERDPGEFPISITSATRGANRGELLYTLETDEISGVFARDAAGIEKRLFHTADFRLRHLDAHPEGSEVAVSIYHRDGTANLALLKMDGSDLTEVTDGESMDLAPRWIPGPGRRLVFQSAGLARDARARYSGYGPSAVQQVDLDTGEIRCLAQAPNFDFLWPFVGTDGALYYIRRPFNNVPQAANPWTALHMTVLMPVRILWAFGKIVELFVQQLTGQPLFPVKDVADRAVNAPSSWLLMRQPPETAQEVETIADGVLSFDLAGDGAIIYSNGRDVYRRPANGGPATKILTDTHIDLVAAL
jgi:hypothetical protein